jgi:DNA-binding CsgD family transcriptional regulator
MMAYRSENLKHPGVCPGCIEFETCEVPCKEVERWIAQDFVGHKYLTERLATITHDFGSHMTYEDFQLYHNGMEPLVDNNQYDTWEILLSLNIGRKNEEVAELYYLEGKRVMQCAKILGISSQGVLVRLRQVEKQIKDRMARLRLWKYDQAYFGPSMTPDHYEVLRLYLAELYSRREIAWIMGKGVAYIYSAIKKLGIKKRLTTKGL